MTSKQLAESIEVNAKDTATNSLSPSENVGRLFTKKRREKQLTLKDISERIHVRQIYIEAIEKGQLYKLPASVYIIGFIRKYARNLGLDDQDILDQIRGEISPQHRTESTDQSPLVPAGPNLPSGRVVLLSTIGAVLFVTVFMAWQAWVPQISDGNQSIVSTGPLSKQLEIASQRGPEKKTIFNTSDKHPLPQQQAKQTIQAHYERLDTQKELKTTTPLMDTQAAPNTIKIHADIASWVELFLMQPNESGQPIKKILISRILKPGEIFTTQSQPGLRLNTGNAGGIRVFVKDKEQDTFGRVGQVIKEIEITSDTSED